MRIAVTGGTGLVGHFIVTEALAQGHEVAILSRTPPPAALLDDMAQAHRTPDAPRWVTLARSSGRPAITHRPFALGLPVPALDGCDALIHAAFDHVPGRYRGGEGDDAAGFMARNLYGSVALFDAAAAAGVTRIAFLSSRAVYEGYPPGTELTEGMPPRPVTLYARAKAEAEAALESLAPRLKIAVSLRATGIYGPSATSGPAHKWTELFARFRDGAKIEPRIGTEVHGGDVARAALRLLTGPERAVGPWNLSDLVLDRRDLLAEVAALTGWRGRLPPRSDAAISVMACDRIRATGWVPRGIEGLRAALPAMT